NIEYTSDIELNFDSEYTTSANFQSNIDTAREQSIEKSIDEP
ncbi:6261_t:CDS:1, partial [Dentiscutata heterogama]